MRGAVGLEYAFLAAVAAFALTLGAAALAEGGLGPVERAIQRAAATAQGADAPGFSARGGGEER